MGRGAWYGLVSVRVYGRYFHPSRAKGLTAFRGWQSSLGVVPRYAQVQFGLAGHDETGRSEEWEGGFNTLLELVIYVFQTQTPNRYTSPILIRRTSARRRTRSSRSRTS